MCSPKSWSLLRKFPSLRIIVFFQPALSLYFNIMNASFSIPLRRWEYATFCLLETKKKLRRNSCKGQQQRELKFFVFLYCVVKKGTEIVFMASAAPTVLQAPQFLTSPQSKPQSQCSGRRTCRCNGTSRWCRWQAPPQRCPPALPWRATGQLFRGQILHCQRRGDHLRIWSNSNSERFVFEWYGISKLVTYSILDP